MEMTLVMIDRSGETLTPRRGSTPARNPASGKRCPGSDRQALRLSEALYHAGYHAPAVRPPTVPQGTARLRINLTCELERAEIDAFADELSGALDESANEAGDG